MKALIVALALTLLNTNAYAAQKKENFYDELDPKRPDIKKVMKELEEDYRAKTGKTGILEADPLEELLPSCYRNSCMIWADVDKSAQRVYLYINGSLSYTWKTSTGKAGYRTPDMDRHPSGPVYDRYTSSKYPDGDYNGLGNMPYAVFVKGGYAIHGTTSGNFGKLGTPASHGCIRLHPDNGYTFNRLVRKYGLSKVWVTVN
ncbi:MAG: L,D-transpeptidase [Bacteriovorax sp.]|nr:L,D-transpeptidase [Bacteriovorax sp.]